jgi:hypothetical protein
MRPSLSWLALLLPALAACPEAPSDTGDGASAPEADAPVLPDAEGPDGTSPPETTTDASTTDDAASLPSSCVPGETRCDGARLATCGSDGRSWTAAACPSGCAAGACAACTPNARSCDGHTVVQCLADGQSTQPVTTCLEGRVCSDGLCLDCAPGARRCDGGAAQVCNAEGAWELATDCAAQGLTCNLGTCAPACSRDPKTRNNAGCDYWAVDLDNNGAAADAQYAVIVSNLGTLPATVTVTRRDSASAEPAEVMARQVAPGGLEILALPSRNMGSPGVHWKGYRISSTAPVVAYQFNPLENVAVYSNDASLLLPVDTFATEFIVMSREQVPGSSATFRGGFSVVAASAQTEVTITPSARTQAGGGLPALAAGQGHTVTLEPYQVLNVKSDQNETDLTGSVVTANRPIGVFGTHDGALSATVAEARSRGLCCLDHLEHQLYPVATWGTSYVAARSQPRGIAPDYWRIVAAEDGTRVTFEPAIAHAPVTLNRGKFIDFPSTRDFVITAAKPVMVGQVLASSGEIVNAAPGTTCVTAGDCDDGYSCEYSQRANGTFDFMCLPPECSAAGSSSGCPNGHVCACPPERGCSCQPLGDPTLILVPPTSQYRASYVFLSPNKYAFDFVNIVAPADAVVALDGQTLAPSSFVAIGGTWKAARYAVQDGVHKVTADKPVGVVVYGYDDDVSYGYAGGLNLVDRAP